MGTQMAKVGQKRSMMDFRDLICFYSMDLWHWENFFDLVLGVFEEFWCRSAIRTPSKFIFQETLL